MLSLWKAIYLGRVYFIVQCVCLCASVSELLSLLWSDSSGNGLFLSSARQSVYLPATGNAESPLSLSFLAHFHFLNFPLLYTIYVPIVYSSSHISPTHKQVQNGSINWISIRHGAVATCNRSIWVYLSVHSGMHSLPLCHLTTDPLNISPAPYSSFISIHLHSRLIRLSVKPLRPLSWNQTNPWPWQ